MKKILLMLLLLLALSCLVFSQTPAKDFEGAWQGTLDAGGTKLRLVVTITKSEAGAYSGKLDSLDQGATLPIGTFKGSTSADFAEDVRAGLAYLRTRPEIRANRLAVLGHSEGAIIAPMVAEKEPTLRASLFG